MEAGCALNPNELIITNGATEAMYLSLQAVTKPGDTVAIESPTYYNLLEILNWLINKSPETIKIWKLGRAFARAYGRLTPRAIASTLEDNPTNTLTKSYRFQAPIVLQQLALQ
jgi:aspartate/methionine/tyrosine aminotransferase